MEAFVPAVLLAILTQIGDRPAATAAGLATRFGRPLLVGTIALIVHLVANGVAAAIAVFAPLQLGSDACTLFLGAAMVMTGVSGLLTEPAAPAPGWLPRHPFPNIVASLSLSVLGDRTTLLTLALAVAPGMAPYAGAGAGLGAGAISMIAALGGRPLWDRLPARPVRSVTGLILLVIGLYLAASALHLIG